MQPSKVYGTTSTGDADQRRAGAIEEVEVVSTRPGGHDSASLGYCTRCKRTQGKVAEDAVTLTELEPVHS